LIARWDGTAWSVVSNPAQTQNAGFSAVVAVNDRDVWAVGYLDTAVEHKIEPLIEHFDGKKWSISNAFVPNSQSVLQAVAGSTAGDVWAGGYYGSGALIEQWNRQTRSWSQVPSPVGGYIGSMSARSPNDVWAVGPPQIGGIFAERWNGSSWNQVQYPRSGTAVLYQVDARGEAGYTWFAGNIYNGYRTTPFVDRYRNGWTDMKVAEVVRHHTELNSLTTVPGSSDVWVAGGYGPSDSISYNLAERYSCAIKNLR